MSGLRPEPSLLVRDWADRYAGPGHHAREYSRVVAAPTCRREARVLPGAKKQCGSQMSKHFVCFS